MSRIILTTDFGRNEKFLKQLKALQESTCPLCEAGFPSKKEVWSPVISTKPVPKPKGTYKQRRIFRKAWKNRNVNYLLGIPETKYNTLRGYDAVKHFNP